MKTIEKIVFATVLTFSAIGIAQTTPSDKLSDTLKPMNVMDEQVNVLNSVFEMMSPSNNPLQGSTNYLELLENSDMDAELKESLRERYEMYDAHLVAPTEKDSSAIKSRKGIE